ncbi:hypothetical protein BsWGS_19433 [Bradybaena similaris]
MGVTGATRVAKWILVVFNVLVLCAGAIAIGLGAWSLTSEYGAETLRNITGSELYRGAAIAIIVGGSVLVVIAFFGAIGAIIESKCLLGIYFVIMLLLLILFVTAAAVGFAYRDKIGEELSKQMEESLLYRYGVDVDDNDENAALTDVWDKLQQNLDCCGVEGHLVNSTKSWFLWQSSAWYKSRGVSVNPELVPSSCCVAEINNASCQTATGSPINQPVKTSLTFISEPNPALNHKGCLDALEDFIMEHIVAIAGIAVAILIVMLVCLLLSVCVCTNIRKSKLDD